MSEEEKPVETTPAAAEDSKEEESTAQFEPVVSKFALAPRNHHCQVMDNTRMQYWPSRNDKCGR